VVPSRGGVDDSASERVAGRIGRFRERSRLVCPSGPSAVRWRRGWWAAGLVSVGLVVAGLVGRPCGSRPAPAVKDRRNASAASRRPSAVLDCGSLPAGWWRGGRHGLRPRRRYAAAPPGGELSTESFCQQVDQSPPARSHRRSSPSGSRGRPAPGVGRRNAGRPYEASSSRRVFRRPADETSPAGLGRGGRHGLRPRRRYAAAPRAPQLSRQSHGMSPAPVAPLGGELSTDSSCNKVDQLPPPGGRRGGGGGTTKCRAGRRSFVVPEGISSAGRRNFPPQSAGRRPARIRRR